jgi:NAD-dependent dihydropyrimidine dehydrogenase PreA subunit
MTEKKTPRVEIIAEQCKGCELCVVECPCDVLFMTDKINHMGYAYAAYTGEGCTGCGVCYYACPEAGTIIVYKKEKGGKDE